MGKLATYLFYGTLRIAGTRRLFFTPSPQLNTKPWVRLGKSVVFAEHLPGRKLDPWCM